MLVARVQGERNQTEAIRAATRRLYRIAPPHLLVAAIQSIAELLAIDMIGGVGNQEQLVKSHKDDFFFDYDAFWRTFSVKKYVEGVYQIAVPFSKKSSSKNSKTRIERRHFREGVAAEIRATFYRTFIKRAE